jgi:hypothetical protein
MNVPYRKDSGIKITKSTPYLNWYPNRAQRRKGPGRPFSNKKGLQVIVTNWGKGVITKVHRRVKYSPGRADVILELVTVKK